MLHTFVMALERYVEVTRLARVMPVVIMLALAGNASAHHTRHHHHHRRAVSHDVTVTPSEAIEERVENEIVRGEDVLDHLGPDNLFASPYLVSAIVYHDGFLSRFPQDKATADPSRRIVAHLTTLVTPEVKLQYVQLLRQHWGEQAAPSGLVQPVNGFIDVRGLRRNHHDAIDIFAAEGSAVYSAASGIVVLADSGWEHGDPFAVSSLRGGNSVVIFDPSANRFYRYCHLGAVSVEPGENVRAGQLLGRVGHTGFNAERLGHGEHLHFEVNQFDGRNVRALDYREIYALLQTATPVTVAGSDQQFADLFWLLPIP